MNERRRLGIAIDASYRIGDHGGVAADPADYPFTLFALEVGKRYGGSLLLARAKPWDPSDPHVALPAGTAIEPLPYYDSLRQVGRVVGTLPRTLAGFWRGLGKVDRVWIFGPTPLSPLLILLAVLRGRQVALGVRQDTVAYYRSRVSGWRWLLAALPVRLLDVTFRTCARWMPATVVGDALAARYARGRAPVLTMTASLIATNELAQAPSTVPWESPIQLLTVGRLEPEKNPLLAAEVLAGLERKRPGRFRLAWIGAGWLDEALRARASALAVADRLELPGFVPFGEALLQRYREADIFLHISWTEGVPQVLVEALACATPIVATDVGGVRAALGEAALLVPPNSADDLVAAILRLDDDPGLRRRLVVSGLELARELTIEVQAGKVARFLHDPPVT